MVPVLSSTTVPTLPVVSSAAAVLNKMPFLAPKPLATIMATGVASPSAHGQLITSTLMARASTNPALRPAAAHAMAVSAASPSTQGTNTAATRSAVLAMGALPPAASSTMRMIC